MKIPNQKKIWDAIAPEWDEYKEKSADATQDFLKNQKGNVLDLGSGSGRHLTKIKGGKMYFVDFSSEMIKLAKEKANKKKINAEFTVANMTKLPYENNFFDAGISISAIHCLPKKEHKKVIKELHRVMKLRAKIFIGVWNKKSKRFSKNDGKEKLIGWTNKGKRYYYLFEEDEIHKLFIDAGFKIISSHNSEMMIRFVVEKF